jgi:signal transduction histidine kinase
MNVLAYRGEFAMLDFKPHSGRSLVLIFVAVSLTFILATVVSQYHAAAIAQKVLEISANAAPSIARLAEARNILRTIETEALRVASERPDGDLEVILASKAHLDEEVQKYLALPRFPGEGTLWTDVDQGLREVERLADRFVEMVSKGSPADQLADVRLALENAIEASSEDFLRSIQFNVERSRKLAVEIEEIRESSKDIALFLDTLCLALAVAAGVLVARAGGRYTALLRSHNELLGTQVRELELFAGRVAHDILSPLNTTALALEAAKACPGQDGEIREDLERGQACLQRIAVMVNGLLEFARSGAKPSPTAAADVRGVVADLASEMSKKAGEVGIDLKVDRFPPCTVAAALGVLTSILSNLLQNAIKYMGDRPVRRINLRVLPREDRVRFEVKDTGPGIPVLVRSRIFEPHVRGPNEKQPGFGLGLATVARLVEGHRGSLGVVSEPGRGSLFWVELMPKRETDTAVEPDAVGTAVR